MFQNQNMRTVSLGTTKPKYLSPRCVKSCTTITALMQYFAVEGLRQWLKYPSGSLAWLFP